MQPILELPSNITTVSDVVLEMNDRLNDITANFDQLGQTAGEQSTRRTYDSYATPASPYSFANPVVDVFEFLDPLYGRLRTAALQVREVQVMPNSIGQNQLQIDSVIARHIVAGSITADKISVNELSAISANMGTLTAGNITLDSSGFIRGGATAYDTGTGFWLGYDTSAYKFFVGNSAGNKLTWDGTNLSITGSITATIGTIGGFTIGSDYIRDVADSMGLASTVTGGDDVRFWAGNTFANRATAPFNVTESGILTATNAAVIVGTVSGRLTATLASAINSSGNLITDVVNPRLDSSSKYILSDFNFGATNYAGAVKSGTITWNTSTGALTGGSGVVVYRGGIIGAASGVATFTLDAATGTATFAGALSAPSGIIGGWTINPTTLVGGNATLDSTGQLILGTTNDVVVLSASDATHRIWVGNAAAGSAAFNVTKAGVMSATGAIISGAITTTSGAIGGWTIGATTLTGGSATLSSTGVLTLGTSNNVVILSAADATYRLWTGHATAASAPFSVTKAGALVASSATITGTVSGRSTATIAGAIDASGNLINDILNARINTSAKTMLSDFSFGATDYAGALKSGTITWNTTTGAITGGSGVLVYRGGIIGAASGVATFTLDAASGSATFSGTLSATAGAIGGFDIGTDYIRDVANSMGLASTVTGGDDVRFWAGATFANRATAAFRVTEAGVFVASSATITGTITSTAGSVGGWSISSSSLYKTTGSVTATLDPTNAYPVLVTDSGVSSTMGLGGGRVTATSGSSVSELSCRNGWGQLTLKDASGTTGVLLESVSGAGRWTFANGTILGETGSGPSAIALVTGTMRITGELLNTVIGATTANTGKFTTLEATSTVKFGTRTAIGAETVTGYITITDSGGTSRKLAVVS